MVVKEVPHLVLVGLHVDEHDDGVDGVLGVGQKDDQDQGEHVAQEPPEGHPRGRELVARPEDIRVQGGVVDLDSRQQAELGLFERSKLVKEDDLLGVVKIGHLDHGRVQGHVVLGFELSHLLGQFLLTLLVILDWVPSRASPARGRETQTVLK